MTVEDDAVRDVRRRKNNVSGNRLLAQCLTEIAIVDVVVWTITPDFDHLCHCSSSRVRVVILLFQPIRHLGFCRILPCRVETLFAPLAAQRFETSYRDSYVG